MKAYINIIGYLVDPEFAAKWERYVAEFGVRRAIDLLRQTGNERLPTCASPACFSCNRMRTRIIAIESLSTLIRDSFSDEFDTIDMILHCPECHRRHIDRPDPSKGWDNPPHRSHLCEWCGTVWRPCDRPTNGVLRITTQGKGDTYRGPYRTESSK